MNDKVQEILKNESLPSPPSVAAALLDLVSQPEVDVNEVTRVISADPGLSAKLINYCNSPIIGSKREIGSLQHAVMVLGLRTIRLLSLSFSIMDTKNDSGFDYEGFWCNSLATAVTSKMLSSRVGGNGEESFLLGLVLNVGQIGIGNTFPDQVIELAGTDALATGLNSEKEVELFGATRFEIGGKMLEKWNFPQAMIEAVSNFNPTELTSETVPTHMSRSLADLLLSTDTTESQIEDVRQQASELFQLDDEAFDALFDALITEWKSYEMLFDYEAIPYDSLDELQMRAKQSLVQISLGMECQIEQMEVEKNQLEKSATIDSLTELKNRRAYDSELIGFISYHKRKQKPMGLIVIDIDHFKSFNDEHGHATGDKVLREVGQILAARCRDYDTVYRYGGEEFVVIVQDCSFENTHTIAERLRVAVSELEVGSLKVTVSLGCCWAEELDFDEPDSLFAKADSFLYQAKQTGRNTAVIGKYADPIVSA